MSNQEKKTCNTCNKSKPISEYYKHDQCSDGFNVTCIECVKVRVKMYNRTKHGLVSKIYGHQKSASNKRGHNPPSYTKMELMDWLFNQELFHNLYDKWVESGYKRDLSPSCDRTDDYKGYSLDRIKVMTWRDNLEKSFNDKRNGNNNKQSKSVIATCIDSGESKEYYSLRKASRDIGIDPRRISDVCNGRFDSYNGYKFKFK